MSSVVIKEIPNHFRGVSLDTETTGMNPKVDRIVELGAIEFDVRNLQPTGRYLHLYINPQMPIPEEASKVHGIKDEDVANAPTFKECLEEIVNFIRGAHVIAHNKPFDERMLNAEIKAACKVKKGEIAILEKSEQALAALARSTECTLALSRRYTIAKKHTLDAICERYGVSLEKRVNHGALLDAELLLNVYPFLKEEEQHRQAVLCQVLPFNPFAEQTQINKHSPEFNPQHHLIQEGFESYCAVDDMSIDDAASRYLQLDELRKVIETLSKPYAERVRELSGGTDMVNDVFLVAFTDRQQVNWQQFREENAPEIDLGPYTTMSSAMSIKYV
jgi:DNA polymerase-3 subunit epsilon